MTGRRDDKSLGGEVGLSSARPADPEMQALASILSLIDDAVLAVDSGNFVRYMNEAAERLTGHSQTESIGAPLDSVLRLRDEQTLADLSCAALHQAAEAPPRLTARLRRREGDEPLVRIRAFPLHADHAAAPCMALVVRDITELRRAEAAQVRLAAIVESSEDAIISKTLEGVIESWNAAAERLFGYTAAEAVGRPITMIIPLDLRDEETYILGRLRAGERIEHFETVRLAKDGRRLDISLTISPVRDRSGHITGVSKIARDITEAKHTQRALREADRRKDEFIALLSHELRNPLAPIGNGLQFMKLLPTNTGDVAQVRDMMERQLRHLVRLVDDLLDVSRVGQNRLRLQRARVTLGEIVDNAVETVRSAIQAAGHELAVSLPATPVYLDVDLTRIAQVLGNLLSNSAKYTDAGGRIELTGTLVDGTVAISVADNGIGIATDDLPRVFDMFAQVEHAVAHSGGGLGIGLALVKGIIEMHGGTVSAQSDGLGKGSTFTVRLPAADVPGVTS